MRAFKKATVASIVLMSLTLTGCNQDVPSDKNRVPGPESSNSAASSPSPSFSKAPDVPIDTKPVPESTSSTEPPLPLPGEEGGIPKEDAEKMMKFIEENPLQIDIDHALKTYADPKVTEVFPKEDFNIKEGVRYGLSLYQDLTNLQDFYEERDTSKDFELILAYADKMTAEYLEKTKTGIKEQGRFGGIPTVDSKGTLGTSKEGIDLNFDGVPTSIWNSPAISTVYDKKYGNVIRIIGERTIVVPVESGENMEIWQTYLIDVVPSGEKDWLVSDMTWSVTNAKVLK